MTDFLANAEKLSELEKLFVQHERFDPLMRTFRTLLYKRVSDIRSSKIRELHGIALSGGSGAGKTRTIEKLIEKTGQDPIIAEQFPKAVVSVKIPSPPKLKLLGIRTLRALGLKLTSERQAWYIWDLVHHQLREQKVLFLHLDEAQDLKKSGSDSELRAIASMLKSLMSDAEWPVGVLLSGTSEIETILNHDPQLGRRMKSVKFSQISSSLQASEIQSLLHSYAQTANLSIGSALDNVSFAERIVHAAANEFGLVIEIILAAIEEAFLEGAEIVQLIHFQRGYTTRTACSPALNPFIATDFYRINTRQVFAREDCENALL